jgi:uncharacterized membrane protein
VTPIKDSIEIARSPEEVFAYLDELERHSEWQEQLISAEKLGDGPAQVGTRSTEKRRMGKREMTVSYEVTEHEPPHVFAFRGIDGPVRAVGSVTVEPLANGSGSWVLLVLDFEGHGFGKLLLPLVRRQARVQVPKDQQRLKERLENAQRLERAA